MDLDFEDVLAGSFGRVVVLFLFLASAIWGGSLIGGLAWFFAEWDLSPHALFRAVPLLWESPLLLINLWLVVNAGVLAISITVLFVSESYGFGAWGFILGLESLLAMLGVGFDESPRDLLVAWSCWLVLLVMVETGIWLTRQMRRNRWAHQMAALSAENAMHRAELQASSHAGDRAEQADLI